MRKNPVLLLTACINPNGMTFTMLQNPKIRATQYMEAIKWYLSNTDFDIVVVENTGYDLRSKFKNISSIEKRIEFLSFKGNDYDKRLGKGYGEGIIVKYAFEHSLFIKIHTEVIKITGRHIVTNVNMIWTSIRLFKMFNKEYVASYFHPNEQLAPSEICIASKDFYTQFFMKRLELINDSKCYYFEHALYDAIQEARASMVKFIPIPIGIRQKGVSGTSGMPLHSSTLKNDIKNFIKCLLLLTKMDKFLK